MTALILAEPMELVITNTTERIDIRTRDDAGDPIDADSVALTILDCDGETVLHKDAYPEYTLTGTVTVAASGTTVTGTGTLFRTELVEGDTVTIAAEDLVVDSITSDTTFTVTTAHVAGASDATATKATRIILVSAGTGHYYFPWGDLSAPVNTDGQAETDQARDTVFLWQAVIDGGEQISTAQTVRCITPKVFTMLHPFRLLIDKAAKSVSSDPDNPCYLGYTDAQLVEWLLQGLHNINVYEPYPTWSTLDSYPVQLFGHLLYESALIAGVMSQQLFAIDTDIPNYSDQGNTFVIQHGPQLAAFLNQITQRLDKLIPQMKLKYVNLGGIHLETGPNYRLTQLINAGPTGALYRSMFFRG